MNCPLCNTPLPDEAVECTNCDWVKRSEPVTHVRDEVALWFSLVPGLGQLYKGHVWLGGLIFFIIGPAALLTGLVLAPATLGVSMIIPLITAGLVAVHAYRAPDVRLQTALAAREFDRRMPAPH